MISPLTFTLPKTTFHSYTAQIQSRSLHSMMETTKMRRVSSAGFRLQPRTTTIRPKSSQSRVDRGPYAHGDSSLDRDKNHRDPVKQDQVWRELVSSERRGVKEWEKNWDFLNNYDQMGEPKPEKPLPSYVPIFSDHVPNTSNQIFGSRLSTPTGKELLRLDRLLFLSNSHQKRKLDPEMLPG